MNFGGISKATSSLLYKLIPCINKLFNKIFRKNLNIDGIAITYDDRITKIYDTPFVFRISYTSGKPLDNDTYLYIMSFYGLRFKYLNTAWLSK